MGELAERSLADLKAQLAEETDGSNAAELEREIGRRHARQGEHDQALRHLVSARHRCELLEDRRALGDIDADLGAVCGSRGDSERAMAYLSRALDLAHELGDADLRARTVNLLADQAMARGDLERAAELWGSARAHYERYWNGAELSRCLAGLAVAAVEHHELDEAELLAARAEEEAETSGDPIHIGRARLARATVCWQTGDAKRAKRFFRRAITLFQAENLKRDLAEAYLRYGLFFGHLRERDGDGVHDPAAFWLAKAQAMFRELGGLGDLERVRDAFRRFGRRATDRVSEVEVLQLLQELKRSRVTVERSTHQLTELTSNALDRAEAGLSDADRAEIRQGLLEVEHVVARSLDEIAMTEERFLAAVNAVVVERENIRSLIELTRSLADTPSYAMLPTRIAEQAAQLTTGERAIVALARDGDDLEPRGAYGIEPESDSAWRAPVEQDAFRRGRAELLYRAESNTDATGETADPRTQRQRQLRLGYGIVVPLRQGEHVFGAIYVDKEISGGVFTERDLDLLSVYAGQAAVILENRRIQDELSLVARARAATLDAVSDAVLSIDASGRITSFNTTAARALGIPAGDKRARLDGNPDLEFLRVSLNTGDELDGRLVTVAATEFLCNTRLIRSDQGTHAGLVATLTELKRATTLAQRMVGSTARYSFGDLIGQSSVLKRQIVLAEAAARSDSNVLITGESGTGKEVLAQAIHNGGPRAAGSFVAINCAAIPRDLLESELFGYESGAFTGARKGGRPGKFELAEGGTILLDEIGDMPLEMQAKLLRVLQERTSQRVGGTREIQLNCRVMATTNRDLAAEVARGMFRQDLFFRLRVIHIDLPPLRARPEDIARLTEHFLRVFSARMGKQLQRIEPHVMAVFLEHPWPGNIRELEHVLESEVNLAADDLVAMNEVPSMLEIARHQPPPMAPHGPFPAAPTGHYPGGYAMPYVPVPAYNSPVKTVSQSERDLLEAALVTHRGKIPAIAEALGISRGTVYNKLKKFNIDPTSYR
ncbi:MAG TPA: sigma 54-interacting transcriptional regulator [Kofleriaceae bacterium]|nr:sigma 54-interacting transcriptional regulator [Kofleriaceae bacterium]